MKTSLIRMIILGSLLSCCISTLDAATWIVEDGQPQAEIVIAERPARAAEFGASELQTYIERITGARLAIVTAPTSEKSVKIFIGESEAARRVGVNTKGLTRDAYRMVSGDHWLALVGNDDEFEPIEPWARNHNDWSRRKQAE